MIVVCAEFLELVEPMAAGDLVPDAHAATCASCAAALAGARHVERLLQARAMPVPPPNFTSRTLARVRRDRWRREQFLDAGFNVALVTVGLAVLSALWLLIDRSGLTGVSRHTAAGVAAGVAAVAERIAPSVPLYAGATALLASVLWIWWWAERDSAI